MESLMSVKVIAFVTVKPGEEKAFEAAASICVAASRSEPGVLHYDLWREAEAERRYVFNELYTDQSAVESHMGSDHFKAFGMAARELAAARPVIIATNPINVAE
jgi:quinol monooxygenase YgiN